MNYLAISFFFICLFLNISYSEVLRKSNNNNNNNNDLLPDIINNDNLDEDELTIVGTADGMVHAVDSNNNKVWSTPTGGPLSKHHSAGNLDYTVIPSSDGSLLIHNSDGGMRKTSVKTRMLAEKSSLMTQDGLIITGHKTSKIFSLDIGNGDVLHDSSDIKKSNNTSRSVISGGLKNNLKSIQDGLNSFSKSNKVLKNKPMWLGRTDYILNAYDGITGLEEFNVSYSEIHPINTNNNFDTDENHFSKEEESNNNYDKRDEISNKLLTLNNPPDSGNERISRSQLKQISTPEGDLFHYDKAGHIRHSVSLGVPIVSVFTVGNINKVHQEYNKNDGKLNHRNSIEYDIRTSPISFRMADALRYTSPIDGDNEESVILVRSLNDGGLYALELPIPTAPLDQQLYAVEPPHLSLTTKEDDLWGFTSEEDNEFEDYTEIDERNLVAIVKSNDYNENNDEEYIDEDNNNNNNNNINKDRNIIDGYYVLPWNERKVNKDKNYKEQKLEKIKLQLDNSYIDLNDFSDDGNSVFVQGYDSSTSNLLDNDKLKLHLMQFFGVVVITLLLIIIYIFGSRINNHKIEIIDDNNYISNQVINNQKIEFDNNINNEIVKYDEDGNKMIIIGSLTIFPSIILGYGSHGTIVFRGCLNGRPVAIKRMLSQFNHRAAEREIAVLIRSDGHSNVVRYYLRESKGEFVYLALQLCKMSLKDFVIQLQKSIISKKYSNQLESSNISLKACKVMDGIDNISDIVRKSLLQIAKGTLEYIIHCFSKYKYY
jgi:hypothetical protein